MPVPSANDEQDPEAGTHLIGLLPCLAFAVGTMVGGGVFTLSGVAINEAGPAALLSYVLAGAVMFVSALSFVAVATRARPGDSGYGPIAEILGPGWRFVVMWGFYLNGLMLLTFLLVSFGDYLHDYFVPTLSPLAAGLLAVGAVAALNLGPADLVGRTETLVVAVKIGMLLVFVAWGLAEIAGPDFTPFAPHGTKSVIEVTALLFTTYTGFNVVTSMAGSVRRPERTVPLAVMGSVIISALIYLGVATAMLASGVRHFGPAGVAEAAEALMGSAGALLIAGAACLSTLSGANANLLGASEVMLRLVAQGDVPPGAGRTTRRGHPFVSVLFIAGAAAVLVLVADIVALANVAALVVMIVIDVAAFRLARRGWPGTGLRLPGGVTIPAVGAITCLAQFPSLETRVRAHVLLCLLAYYLTWHLRAAWAPLIFKDENPPINADPVAKATRSPAAQAKASTKRTQAGDPCHSYTSLLTELATQTRNTIRLSAAPASFEKLTQPTDLQARALDLATNAPVTT